ncbi:hypothetical protein NDU88_003558 [Pleurodeles waltl]|uniref:Uncharacterized protein n=1 Tax=Pleurodeles waltl TaxID=8319 RepID=A0AAV7RHS4_PLEWA|nr:hypothetical protein NDU88_003558 [Pleurodeles waltl]
MLGGDSQLSGTAPPVETERNERWSEKPRLPSNLSEHMVQWKIPIFRTLTKRSEEVMTGAGIERELLPVKSAWVESDLHSPNNVTEDLSEGVSVLAPKRVHSKSLKKSVFSTKNVEGGGKPRQLGGGRCFDVLEHDVVCKESLERGKTKVTVPEGFCGLQDVSGSMLHKVGRCSGDQPAKFGVTWENQQEVRERFRATVPTVGEHQITSEVQKKNVDWKNFDGGAGDGERAGTSFGNDDTEICELDYDEESNDLKEGISELLGKNQEAGLQEEHITVSGEYVRIFLEQSKTDQRRKGATVSLKRIGGMVAQWCENSSQREQWAGGSMVMLIRAEDVASGGVFKSCGKLDIANEDEAYEKADNWFGYRVKTIEKGNF